MQVQFLLTTVCRKMGKLYVLTPDKINMKWYSLPTSLLYCDIFPNKKDVQSLKYNLFLYNKYGATQKIDRRLHTTLHHARFIALAESTGLAALATALVNGALVGGWTNIVIVS